MFKPSAVRRTISARIAWHDLRRRVPFWQNPHFRWPVLGTRSCPRQLTIHPTPWLKEAKMLGKMTFAVVLFVGTGAFAQETNNPTAPTNPAAPYTPPIQNLAACWDAATNQVRNSPTVGLNPSPTATPNQQTPTDAKPATNRPAGMANC
jgi:hypothetical protein